MKSLRTALAAVIAICILSSAKGWWFDGEVATAILNPFDAVKARTEAQNSLADAQRLYPSSVSDGVGDAFRHALWNFRMTQTIGKSEAKKFADAHEEGNFILNGYNVGNNPASKAMDLFNNNVGRNLLPIPGKTDIEVVQKALAEGRLQTSP